MAGEYEEGGFLESLGLTYAMVIDPLGLAIDVYRCKEKMSWEVSDSELYTFGGRAGYSLVNEHFTRPSELFGYILGLGGGLATTLALSGIPWLVALGVDAADMIHKKIRPQEPPEAETSPEELPKPTEDVKNTKKKEKLIEFKVDIVQQKQDLPSLPGVCSSRTTGKVMAFKAGSGGITVHRDNG